MHFLLHRRAHSPIFTVVNICPQRHVQQNVDHMQIVSLEFKTISEIICPASLLTMCTVAHKYFLSMIVCLQTSIDICNTCCIYIIYAAYIYRICWYIEKVGMATVFQEKEKRLLRWEICAHLSIKKSKSRGYFDQTYSTLENISFGVTISKIHKRIWAWDASMIINLVW